MLRNKKGFSLVELVVVMAIMTTLVFVASTTWKPVADTSEETVLITNCARIKSLIEDVIGESGITDFTTAGEWIVANADALIENGDIVNVFSEPRDYQIVNGSMFPEAGMVWVNAVEAGYIEIYGWVDSVSPGTYVPHPALRVRW